MEKSQYSFTLEDLKKEYLHRLEVNQRNSTAEKEATVEKMINAINNSKFPSDWIRHNPSLKQACAKFGITKSGELREFVKSHFEAQQQELKQAEITQKVHDNMTQRWLNQKPDPKMDGLRTAHNQTL